MDIDLYFDNSKESEDLVKFSVLYFDKVNILCPFTNEDNNPDSFIYDKKAFENLDDLLAKELVRKKYYQSNNPYLRKYLSNMIRDFIMSQSNIDNRGDSVENWRMIEYHNAELIEMYRASRENLAELYDFPLNNQGRIFFNFYNSRHMFYFEEIYRYHSVQLNMIHNSMHNKSNVIACNSILSGFYKWISDNIFNNEKSFRITDKYPNSFVAYEAMPILMPTFYQMSFENLIELKQYAKDELLEMRYYLDSLSLEISPDDLKLVTLKRFLEKKINPSIKQLESKIYSLKAKSIQTALKSLKNPLSYTPMITTLFSNIPTLISMAMSIGLITIETGLGYAKEKKEIETDPLYFTVKLKKIIK